MALMARAHTQAQKFGVEMAIPDEAIGLEVLGDPNGHRFLLKLSDSQRVSARSVVIASGARYRRLTVENLEAFEGTSVHYWASPLEAKLCAARSWPSSVAAILRLRRWFIWQAKPRRRVWLLVRGPDLSAGMSRYLVDRIAGLANVEVLTQTAITGLEGRDGMLEAIRWRCGKGEEERHAIQHLFLFIGAEPNTGLALENRAWHLMGRDSS